MSEVINKDNREITKEESSRRNRDFNWKCLIILSFFILSAISIFSFSRHNGKFLVNFKSHFDKKNQKKKEPVKYTYSFYAAEIIKIISPIITILGILILAKNFYKDFFLKKRYEIANKEENYSCFIKMLLDICLDEKDENSLRYREYKEEDQPLNNIKYANYTKHNRRLFFSCLLKKHAKNFTTGGNAENIDIDKKIDEKIEKILTKEKLASLFGALIEIQNAEINYFHLLNTYSFKELSGNEVYKKHRNRCLLRTLLQFFNIIAYYTFGNFVVSKEREIFFSDLDDVEKEIKKRADENNFVLVDQGKYVFSGVSLEEDLNDLYNNIDTDIDID